MITAAFAGRIGGFQLDAAFTAPARGVTALFGPSGCGKTSILRCIAGLQRAEHGVCIIDGEVWQDATRFRPTHLRPIGMVFQEASLFAHLDVRHNLRYGESACVPPDGFDFEKLVDLLGLASLLDRSPRHLSGGERQRVAIGRALLSQPRLLLLDEPLSGLDQAGKNEVMHTLERLHATLRVPIIIVSHDIAEVERLADHLVLIEAGRVIASGALTELQHNTRLPLAIARDAAVSLTGVLAGHDGAYGLARFDVAGAVLLVPTPALSPGATMRLRIAARDVSIALPPLSAGTISNTLPAVIIESRAIDGHEMLVQLGLGEAGLGARVLARVTRWSWDQLRLADGMAVLAQIKSVALAAGTAADQP